MFQKIGKNHGGKWAIPAGLGLLCLLVGIGWFAGAGREEKREPAAITTLSIDHIEDKFQRGEEYFLTVALEDWLVESYQLSYDSLTFQTGPEIYQNVVPGERCSGVCLKLPGKAGGLGAMLKEKRNDLCEIVSVTTGDNRQIAGT